MSFDIPTLQAELERILISRCFRSRKVLQKFLRYIVEESLAGNAIHITQQNIAINGLDRHKSFDNIDNPLVRVQAGRLRKQLEDYYATEGRFNPIRIELPMGSYRPEFHQHISVPAEPEHYLSQGPSVVCLPRTFITDTTLGWSFISRVTRDYVIALTQFAHCQVKFADETPWQQTNWPQDAWLNYNADFALFFDLHAEKNGYDLKCSLVHRHNNQIVWAHSFALNDSSPEPTTLHAIFKRIAHDTISTECGIAQDYWVRQLLASGAPIAPYHQVVVAFSQYARDVTHTNFCISLRACEQRLAQFPQDTLTLIIYANLCRADYLLKYHEITPLLPRLNAVVDTLLQVAPNNAYSYLFLAMLHLLTGNDDECLAALQQAQSINSLDTNLNLLIGLIHIGLEDWQTGIELIQDSITISINHPDWYHIPVCLYHYREGRYLAAMQEAKKVRIKHLWGPMLRTALDQFNDLHERRSLEYQQFVDEYPDFAQKGQTLAQGLPQETNHIVSQLLSKIPM